MRSIPIRSSSYVKRVVTTATDRGCQAIHGRFPSEWGRMPLVVALAALLLPPLVNEGHSTLRQWRSVAGVKPSYARWDKTKDSMTTFLTCRSSALILQSGNTTIVQNYCMALGTCASCDFYLLCCVTGDCSCSLFLRRTDL